MAEADWNPDTAGRSLAEILREAGIEAPRSGRRRRWDDPEDTGGIRQRRSGPPSGDTPSPGRRASDLRGADDELPVRRAADPSTAAIPGLRPSRTPDVPGPPTPSPVQRDRPAAERTPDRERPGGRDRGPDRAVDRDRVADRVPGRDRSAGRGQRGAEPAAESTGRVADRPLRRAPVDEHPSTGPIPVVRDADAVPEDDAGPGESALAWLRFAGELVIALAAGIGVYFLATVLWEQLPYLAVVLAPVAVTGLVAGVSVFRRRLGREPMGAALLAVLVFAGALLTVLPAAGLLDG
jgi:hypothetical protein